MSASGGHGWLSGIGWRRRPRPWEAAAESMVGLHASDPASVFLAARARMGSFAPRDLERVLYDHRTLVRMVGMRRTLFVLTADVAAVMDAACTRALVPGQRRRLVKLVEDQAIADDGAAWLDWVCRSVLEALGERGEATAVEPRKTSRSWACGSPTPKASHSAGKPRSPRVCCSCSRRRAGSCALARGEGGCPRCVRGPSFAPSRPA